MKILKTIVFLAVVFLTFFYSRNTAGAPYTTLPDIRTYSIERVLERWGGRQWTHLNTIIKRESRWDPEAQNPNSTAYGLGQFLDSTWAEAGCQKTEDPYRQIDCTIEYIAVRYDTPERAKIYHDKKGFY